MKVLGETSYRVFGSASFRGNPVTLFEVDGLDDGTALLHVANNSRTEDNVFFIVPGGGPVKARFFSSSAELWLCGHGLLALAHRLHATGIRDVQSTHGSWQIHGDADGPGVSMPAQHAAEIRGTHWMSGALRSIGLEHAGLYAAPNGVWIVLLRDLEELRAIDAAAIASMPTGDTPPGALIAALWLQGLQGLQNAGYGFRYFAPWHGKPEDSGTGSAHCYLAPLLAPPRDTITALQFSPEGIAEMRICLRGNAVSLAGRVEP